MRKIVMVCMLLAFAGCGANTRTKALRVGLVSLNAARDTTLEVSKAREALIVEQATTKDEGRAALDTWRAKVDVVFVALDAGYRAVFSASLLNDAKSASEAGAAIAKALALVKELGK